MIKILNYFSQNDILRLKKNFFSRSNYVFVKVITSIFFIPLMIYIWGIEKFGIWSFLYSIPQVINLIGLNFTEASKTSMTLSYYSDTKKLVDKIYLNTIYLIIGASTFLIILFIFFINFFDLTIFKIFENLNNYESTKLIILSFIFFILNFINSIFYCGITYKGQLNIYTNIEIVTHLISIFFILVIGIFTKNLIYLFLGIIFISFFKIYFSYLYSSKNIKIDSLKSKIDFNILKNIIKKSFAYYLENGSVLIKHNFVLLIIGIYFNATIVGYVSAIKTLFYFFPNQILNIFASIFQFEYSKLISQKKIKKLKEILIHKLKFILVMIIIYIIVSLYIGDFVFNMWTNKSYIFNYSANLFIIAEFSIYTLVYFVILPAKSRNLFFNYSLIDFIFNSLAIAFSILLIKEDLNLSNIFLAVFIGTLISSIFKILLIYKDFFSKKRLIN